MCGRLPSAREALRVLTPLSARLRTSSASGCCRLPRCPAANRGSPLWRSGTRLVDRQQKRGLHMIQGRKERKSGGGRCVLPSFSQPDVKTTFSTRGQICVCVCVPAGEAAARWRVQKFPVSCRGLASNVASSLLPWHRIIPNTRAFKPVCRLVTVRCSREDISGFSSCPDVSMMGMTCTSVRNSRRTLERTSVLSNG